jgi:hypothetical protein
MKHELVQRPLSLPASQAYDRRESMTRTFVVERSLGEYFLHEPVGTNRAARARAEADAQAHCGNPFRDEPNPALVTAVRHFGVAGLVAGAVGTAISRWCRSLLH